MSSLLAFPGQGAQQPHMLHGLPACNAVQRVLEEASDALHEDVLALDSPQALQHSRAVQLCLLVAGVASARLLLEEGPAPDFVAGLSIGAYGAAVVAGALPFPDAVRLVALRGQLMQQAYPEGYGMTAILGLERHQLEALLARVHSQQTPVYLANVNAASQMVVAGSDAAMAALTAEALRAGATGANRLSVTVPSHCELLQAPAARLAAAFKDVRLQRPGIKYLSATRARPIFDSAQLADDLTYNMCRVVDWHTTLRTAYERGVRLHIELLPGTVLTGLARPVFMQGNAFAFQGTRLDTLRALLRREVSKRS